MTTFEFVIAFFNLMVELITVKISRLFFTRYPGFFHF